MNEALLHEHIALGMNFNELNYHDRRCARYLTHNVHGMLFKDYGHEKYQQTDIPKIVKEFVCKDLDEPIVGYKGGQYEKQLLDKISIKSINLEILGCPRFDALIQHSMFSHVNVNTSACQLHKNMPHFNDGRNVPHCSVLEVQVFRNWYLYHLVNKLFFK